MSAQNQPTPRQLAKRIAAGMSISMASLLGIALTSSKHLQEIWRLHTMRLPIGFALLALFFRGQWIALGAEGLLQQGIRDEKWLENQLEPLRLWINRRQVTLATFILMIAGIVWCGADLLSMGADDSWGPFIILIFFAAYLPTILRLKTMLRPPSQSAFTNVKPFQSEHWGEGRAPDENSSH